MQRFRQVFSAILLASNLIGSAFPVAAQQPQSETQPSTHTYQCPTSRPTIPKPHATLSNNRHYINFDGATVHAPAFSFAAPAGASAHCGDGSYSFSQHPQGICSHHGGVSQWLR